jgi:tetratricopeptide (TPR) repeat protein
MQRSLEKGREAVDLDPNNPITHAWLSVGEADFGHNEAARKNSDAAVREWKDGSVPFTSVRMALSPFLFTAYRDELTGDFAEANAAWAQFFARDPGGNGNRQNAASDAAATHDFRAAARILSTITEKDPQGRPDYQLSMARMNIAFLSGDWAETVMQAHAADAILSTQSDNAWNELLMWPEWAYALARMGDFRGADAVIAKTTQDCDDCLLQRGRIAALEGRPDEAAQDFSVVAARSPHEPFAETYWGEMLLHKGDLDGAIAKLETAHKKGPRFADPLEMWGEALIAKNRSDLALTKFEEANKYAPNWGRLHLKWGAALWWAGRKGDAQEQFAIAASLDMTPSEKSELAKVSHG